MRHYVNDFLKVLDKYEVKSLSKDENYEDCDLCGGDSHRVEYIVVELTDGRYLVYNEGELVKVGKQRWFGSTTYSIDVDHSHIFTEQELKEFHEDL